MLTSSGFEGVDDGAAVGGKSFIVEVENPVSLDVEERVEVEVGLGIVLVVILVTGGMLEEGVEVEEGLRIVG